MATRSFEIRRGSGGDIGRSPVPALVVMAAALVIGVLLLFANSDEQLGIPYPYLLPWLLMLAVALAVPSVILYYQGKLRLDNPLVFATFSYFYPAFVLGGFMFAVGLSKPSFETFIQDPREDLPFTVQLIIFGFLGLAVGYLLPVGKKIGEYIASKLPRLDFSAEDYRLPGAVLLILGIMNSIMALGLGLFGFQRASEIGAYDGVIFLTTLFWLEGSFVLWLVLFREKRWDSRSYLILGLLGVTALSKALYAGNRGSLIQIFIVILIAFMMAGRKIGIKEGALAGVLLVVALIAGTIYGTTFRNVKGDENTAGVGEYTASVFDTLDKIGSDDQFATLNSGFSTLAERIDTLSTVAVVASNYEQLAPYEESYDLDHNIWKDTTSFLIPRVIWKDKPVASQPRKYSELYFNYGENSFAITPIGDLVRNYGPIGVPIGMLLLGILLRAIYRALVEDQAFSMWRSAIYFMILTSVSYEGFYGTLVPYSFKIGVSAVVGVIILFIVARMKGARSFHVTP